MRLIDLQADSPQRFTQELIAWRPAIVAFAGNYVANLPEIIDLATLAKRALPEAVRYEMEPPPRAGARIDRRSFYLMRRAAAPIA